MTNAQNFVSYLYQNYSMGNYIIANILVHFRHHGASIQALFHRKCNFRTPHHVIIWATNRNGVHFGFSPVFSIKMKVVWKWRSKLNFALFQFRKFAVNFLHLASRRNEILCISCTTLLLNVIHSSLTKLCFNEKYIFCRI